jgi:hypothetical protein
MLHSLHAGLKRGYTGTLHQLFIDFDETYDQVRREVLYNIFIEFAANKNVFKRNLT